jgi:thioredoxin-related protein
MRLSVFLRYLVALAVLTPALAQAGEVPPAQNLRADGAIATQKGLPILLFYTASYCRYCDAVKAEFLGHMAIDPAYQTRAIFREVRIDSSTPLVDFNASITTHHHFADQRPITLVPTVEFVDGSGKHLAAPMIGASIPDFYGAYLDRGIEHALVKIRSGRDPS